MDITIDSAVNSVRINVDGNIRCFGPGELHPSTPDGAGNTVYIQSTTGVVGFDRNEIIATVGTDNINVNGVTVFADASELVLALADIFFLLTKGDANPNAAQVLFSQEDSILADSSEIDTGFLDFKSYTKQQISVSSDTQGLTFVQTLKSKDDGAERVLSIPLPRLDSTFSLPARFTLQRLQVQNNSGVPISNVAVQVKAFVGGDGATVTTLDTNLVGQSQALLTRSVLAGNPAGKSNFVNVAVNDSGALLTSDYGTEVALGAFPNVGINKKFGRNPDIGSGSTPEDVWSGGGLYTGFNCVAAQTLEFFSSSASDTGTLIDSGVATGGSETTLLDSAATFLAAGVLVGDLVINDLQSVHGIVSSVDSETQITMFDITDGEIVDFAFEPGDAYRIARATSTGAAVCKVASMLDANYDSYSEYIILNGVSAVDTVGTYLRQSSGRVILAGSSGANDGQITGRQKTTTANITMVMPVLAGRTAICCETVPRGEKWVVKNLKVQMARSNGTPGSASPRFQTRKRGEAWQTRRFPEISNGQEYATKDQGGIVVSEFTDIKWNIQSVSDNGTIISAEFEYFITR